jgi:two-component system, cell cycle response regulator
MAHAAYQKLKDTNALPSPTGVALKLLRLTANENASIDAIVATVESDPALAGRVLKLVNSAFSGVPRRVAAVSVAIRLLGTRTLKNLALGLSLLSNNRSGSCQAFDYEAFWSESLARAVAARQIAAQVGKFPPDDAFTTGLLSKIGRLALATVQPHEYACVLDMTGHDDGPELNELERKTFGIDHDELAAEMMSDWHLPDVLCAAVRFQDEPSEPVEELAAEAGELARTLRLAGFVARMLVKARNDPEVLTALVSEASALGIDGAVFRQVFGLIGDKWRELGTIFSVSTCEMPPADATCTGAQPASVTADNRRTPAEAPGDACPRVADALRILIVDDDPAALRLLERYLIGDGYKVITAGNGIAALDADRLEAPQIVITDWAMPGMGGLELCRRLREHEGSGFVYIIVLTAHTEKGREVGALDAGADDFLCKPYTRHELLTHVRAGERIARLEAKLGDRSRELSYYNAQLAAANDKLRILATTDELTGLANRREALARLAEHWALAERYGDPVSAIVVDIDLFKHLNDTHGHAAGDCVLKATADALRETARAGELACRIGGEEFLVVCPRATAAAAELAAERMRVAVAANVTLWRGVPLSVTISAGVAERGAGARDVDELLRTADEALYVAKQTGRNRTCVAGRAAKPATGPVPTHSTSL